MVEPIRFRLITGHAAQVGLERALQRVRRVQGLRSDTLGRRPRAEPARPRRSVRLIDEVNEVLFLWVMASDHPGDQQQARRAAAICERALLFAEPKGPWHALKARYDGREPAPQSSLSRPWAESSARACFQWGLLALLDGRPEKALAWFDCAVSLRPDQYWYQFALAYHHALYGDAWQAMAHYDAAVALRPESSWALMNRGQLAWSRLGAWERAIQDLDRVRTNPDGLGSELLALELGRVAQRLGDYPSALQHYQTVISANGAGDLTRRARLNRARVDLELGPAGRARAWADYERLVGEDSGDSAARLGHALVALRTGRPDVADDEPDTLAG